METPRSAKTPTTPKSPTLQIRTFSLWCNNKRYDFEAEVFAKMSRKCAQLVREGQTQGIIERRIRTETFDAFVAACQLKAFKVTATNAYELKNLAIEWGVSSLETFVDNYIKSKNLRPPSRIDHLGVLIDHLDHGIDDPNDILAVANNVNDALRDDRFERVAPEVIFKILIASDQKRQDLQQADPLQDPPKPDHQILDQQLLIKFTLNLMKDPQLITSAIPLTLMIDFKLLTKEQRDFIFQCKEMHEQNIGYFVAHSMSATRNKAERELAQSEAQLLTDLNALRENLKQHQRSNAAKLKKEQEESIGDLKEALLKQQETIKDLQDRGVEFESQLDADADKHEDRFQKMKGILDEIDQYTSQRNSIATDKEVLIKGQVADQLAPLKQELNEQVKKLSLDDATRCAELEERLIRLVDGEKKRLRQLATRIDDSTEDVDTTNVELSDIKATLAAKIVHDRLRFDKFLRKTDDRFAVFIKTDTEPGVWDLAPERVAQAEQFVVQIENIVDANCPIRGGGKVNQRGEK
ncbi:hypothetical protein TRFO_28025 [Tritrichomonas foetus]|uniref:Uncharacterized protein n=1 Tax=Tritrichomonas foetus TaxID=1144522 RepID=A0A1J4JZA9_9EUKA|nr:hypothetical protein TRFO_28025 [Tritrichomonas foetus]|eukprot:OHT04511.1 hypothetical protein TRFO_28025 [Tritrichomonas foetus]